MRFAILLYQDEAVWERATDEERAEELRRHDAFDRAARERGLEVVGGEGLAPVAHATTVRERGRSVTEGPFAETTEQLGGFYVVDAPDLDTVLELVPELPAYTIEIRPVLDLSEQG